MTSGIGSWAQRSTTLKLANGVQYSRAGLPWPLVDLPARNRHRGNARRFCPAGPAPAPATGGPRSGQPAAEFQPDSLHQHAPAAGGLGGRAAGAPARPGRGAQGPSFGPGLEGRPADRGGPGFCQTMWCGCRGVAEPRYPQGSLCLCPLCRGGSADGDCAGRADPALARCPSGTSFYALGRRGDPLFPARPLAFGLSGCPADTGLPGR